MEKLVIPLTSVTEDSATIDVVVSEAELRPEGVERFPIGDVRVSGELEGIDSEYLFRGVISGIYQRPCDRCLTPARDKFSLEVVWFYEPGVSDRVGGEFAAEMAEAAESEDVDGRQVRHYSGAVIDLRPDVWEEIMLAAPGKFLCKPDCKGLCPNCGQNLNEGLCSCPKQTDNQNSGLAALADMFPDLRSTEE